MYNGTLHQNEDEYEGEVEEEVEVEYSNDSKSNLTNAYTVSGEYTSPTGSP